MREALRLRDVQRATGMPKSTIYLRIKEGTFPRPVRIDPQGRVVVWWRDEIEKIQAAATPSPPSPLKKTEAA